MRSLPLLLTRQITGSTFPRRTCRSARCRPRWAVLLLVCAFCSLLGHPAALGLDYLKVDIEGKEQTLTGRVVVEASDGGVMFQGRDGQIHFLEADAIIDRASDDQPFSQFDANEMARRVLAELPPGFDVHKTANYLVFYDTSRAYAQWCAALLERLHAAFLNYWDKRDFALKEPDYPLVAFVFANKREFAAYAATEDVTNPAVLAYYNLLTNRLALYDLTGLETGSKGSRRGMTSARINAFLSRPGAAYNVATIVHEATHQIAYNCGLHARFSDCPLWLAEGIATYFETPDLSSSRGWGGIGNVNPVRLRRFLEYLRRRPPDSLKTLVADDNRMRGTAEDALDAYAEAWALTYFLLHQYPDVYTRYLTNVSEKRPQRWNTPDERWEEFKAAFGDEVDMHEIDRQFVRYIIQLR